MGLRPTQGNEKRLGPASTLYGTVTLSLSSRPEQSWACSPPRVIKNASVRHPRFMEPLPFPCHPDRSEAERRDLRFRGPFVEMFFDRA
jgi:hypothetical protein